MEEEDPTPGEIDFATMSAKEIQAYAATWTTAMFTHTKEKKADINSVALYAPLLQLCGAELTSRFVKRTTLFALGVSVLAFFVSLVALWVAAGSPWLPVSTPQELPIDAPKGPAASN